MSTLYWMLFGELIIFAISYKVSRGDLLAPSVVSILMFILSTIGIIFNREYWNVKYSSETVMVVIFTLLMMLLAEITIVLTSKKCKRILKKQNPINLEKKEIAIPLRINLLIVAILGILTVYYIFAVFKAGKTLGAVGLASIGVVKYSEEGVDIISRVGFRLINIFYFIYLYILINNIVVCKRKFKNNIINLLPVLFGFFIMFFSGSRKLLVQYPSSLLLIYVIRKRDIFGRKNISTLKLLKMAVPVCVIILAFFYGMREISKASTALGDRTVVDYLTYYISSPLYLLDRYITNPTSVCTSPIYFGQYTFLAIYNTLNSWGILDFEVPSNKFQIISSQAYMAGNELTWIQRPYEDFGFAGMLVLTFFLFLIYNYIYFKKIICRKDSRKRDTTIIVYSYFYFIVVLCFYCTYTITEVSLQSLFYMFILIFIYRTIVHRYSVDYKP